MNTIAFTVRIYTNCMIFYQFNIFLLYLHFRFVVEQSYFNDNADNFKRKLENLYDSCDTINKQSTENSYGIHNPIISPICYVLVQKQIEKRIVEYFLVTCQVMIEVVLLIWQQRK